MKERGMLFNVTGVSLPSSLSSHLSSNLTHEVILRIVSSAASFRMHKKEIVWSHIDILHCGDKGRAQKARMRGW